LNKSLFDESPKQLIGETRLSLAAEPGKPACFDTEHIRRGACGILMFAVPLEGWRRAGITERRTRADGAEQIRRLVDEDFPHAEKIVLVMDNLNTHTAASVYERFPSEEAKRIKDKGGDRAECDKPSGAAATDTRDRGDAERGGGVEPEAEQGSL
jgi:hypothetical protein